VPQGRASTSVQRELLRKLFSVQVRVVAFIAARLSGSSV
jgi:hypothetical protein